MDARKDLLLKSAARLYSLGVGLEMAREKLRPAFPQHSTMKSWHCCRKLADFLRLFALFLLQKHCYVL